MSAIPDLPYQILLQDGLVKLLTYSKCNRTPQPITRAGDHRTVFYAESSLLMHYLYATILSSTSPYFELKIDRGASVEDAFQRSFGMSTDQFDKTLRVYLTKEDTGTIRTNAGRHCQQGLHRKTVSSADSDAVLADIHFAFSRLPRESDCGIRGNPQNQSEPCRIVSRIRFMPTCKSKILSTREKYFKRAAQATRKIPVHYYSRS